MLPPATADLYRANQVRYAATIRAVRALWATMGDDFDASWARIGARITAIVSAAQLGAARDGAESVGLALEQTGFPVEPEGIVRAQALAGVASDGRPLASLLYGAVTTAKTTPESLPVREWTTPRRLERGGAWLDMAVQTQVADAARSASTVGIVARPEVGYVRMVNPPCCSRCAVLAGKWFRWNQGFQRHPRCDCVHRPAHSAEGKRAWSTPLDLDQVTGLSAGERRALDLGADLGQVVNARRGASGMTTTEGMSRRGYAGQHLGKGAKRLTPDAIIALHPYDRQAALDLLRRHGYLA